MTEPDWTEEDIKSNFGWTEKQLRAARASGFPKPTGHRTNFDGDGVPTDRTMTWTAVNRSQLVQPSQRARMSPAGDHECVTIFPGA